MTLSLKTAGLALAATGLALSGPASAAPAYHAAAPSAQTSVFGETVLNHGRDKYRDRRDYRNYGQRYDRNYAEPVYRDTQVWRGDDGRYYCKEENGTTGLLIGAGVGGLIGHEVAGRNGDRTLGAILGAAGGALLGRAIDRSSTKCR